MNTYIVTLTNGDRYEYDAESEAAARAAFGGQVDSVAVRSQLVPPEAAKPVAPVIEEENPYKSGLAQFGLGLASEYGATKAARLAGLGRLASGGVGLASGILFPPAIGELTSSEPSGTRFMRDAGLSAGVTGGLVAAPPLTRFLVKHVGSKVGGVPVQAMEEWGTTEGRAAIKGAEGKARDVAAKITARFDKANFDQTFPEANQVREGLAKFSPGGPAYDPSAISTAGALESLQYRPELVPGGSMLAGEEATQAALSKAQRALGPVDETGNIIPAGITPEQAWNLRRRFGDETSWNKPVGTTPAEQKAMKGAYQTLRTDVRNYLESKGEDETLAAMDALANKMRVRDEAGEMFGNDMDVFRDKLEQVVSTIVNDKSVGREQKARLLREIESTFGIKIMETAENISKGRMLGMEGGNLPWFTRSNTGAGGSVVGAGLTALASGNPATVLPYLALASPRVVGDYLYATQKGGPLREGIAHFAPALGAAIAAKRE